MIAYRQAVPADGPALDAMARKIWLETFGAHYAQDDLDHYLGSAYGPDGRLLKDLAGGEAVFRIACDPEAGIVGYAKVNAPWLPDAEPGALQLSQLYVATAWHGRGVAGPLMDWAVAHGRDRGAAALLLTVWEENRRALRFYEKLGFVHVGDYAFPVGEKIDRDLILRLAL